MHQQPFSLIPFNQMLRTSSSAGYPNMSFFNPGQVGADPYGQPFQMLAQQPHRFPMWQMQNQRQPLTSFYGRKRRMTRSRGLATNPMKRPRPTQQQIYQSLAHKM